MNKSEKIILVVMMMAFIIGLSILISAFIDVRSQYKEHNRITSNLNDTLEHRIEVLKNLNASADKYKSSLERLSEALTKTNTYLDSINKE